MGAVWLWARADLRRRWRTAAFIGLILGLAGAFALTALVGARRTTTVWERFRAETLAADAFVSIPSRDDPAATGELRSLPGVVDAAGFVYVAIAPPGMPEAGAFAAVDQRLGHTVSRPRIIEGRRARPAKADEVTVNPAMAEAAKVGPGDRLKLAGQGESHLSMEVTVVGVHVGTTDISFNATFPSALLTPAFLAEHGTDVDVGRQNQFVRLESGDNGVPAFRKAVIEHFGGGGGILVGQASEEESGITDALRIQAISLALVASAAAAAALVVVGQALARHVAAGAADREALGALGVTRWHQVATALPTVTLVAVLGTASAMAVAIAASPLVPTGLARHLEPDPGVTVDALALLGGGVLLGGLVALAGTAVAVRSARRAGRAGNARPPRLRPLLAPLGPVATVGIHNALGAGPARAAARSAVAAAGIATMAITAAATFAVSLDHLVENPRLYGWDFDLLVGAGGEDPDEVAAAAAALAGDRQVERVTVVEVDFLTIGGQNVETLILDQQKGEPIHPTLAEGRAPTGHREIALGSTTMKRLGVDVGDQVEVATEDDTIELTLVGQGVYPVLGDGTITNAASIAAAAATGLRREESRGRHVMLDVASGADPSAVVRRHTRMFVSHPLAPSEVTNLRQVGGAPWALAAFLAVLGLAAVGHALVLSVRAGRRNFAVLRALGFASRQVRSAVFWQASTIVIVGLIGIPVGVIIGRWAWMAAGSGTGAVTQPVTPAAFLAAAAAAALLAGNLLAAVPGHVATRMRTAQVLRAE